MIKKNIGEKNMVATMSVYYDFGGTNDNPGTEQDIDALGPPRLRFKDADNATIDTNRHWQAFSSWG